MVGRKVLDATVGVGVSGDGEVGTGERGVGMILVEKRRVIGRGIVRIKVGRLDGRVVYVVGVGVCVGVRGREVVYEVLVCVVDNFESWILGGDLEGFGRGEVTLVGVFGFGCCGFI